MPHDILTQPLTRATTAYAVLDQIKQLVTDDPLRLAMNHWLVHTKGMILEQVTESERMIPSCGTVGCVGGWADALIGGSLGHKAMHLSYEQRKALFYPTIDDGRCFDYTEENAQTSEHAAKVVQNITEFQHTYEHSLKATHIDINDTNMNRQAEVL